MTQVTTESGLTLLWNQILLDLKREIIKPLFNTWIVDMTPIELTEGELIIGTPKQFVKEWMEERYNEFLKDSVKRYLGKDLDIVYINLDIPLPISKASKPRSQTPIEKLLLDFQGLTSKKQDQVIKFVESLQIVE